MNYFFYLNRRQLSLLSFLILVCLAHTNVMAQEVTSTDTMAVHWHPVSSDQGVAFEMGVGECGTIYVLKIHNSNSRPASVSYNLTINHDSSVMDYHVMPFMMEAGETKTGTCENEIGIIAFPIMGNGEIAPELTITAQIAF